jgi:Domain of unknown function (DUF4328)
VECTQCGTTLGAQDLTCPQCGHSRVDRIRWIPPTPQGQTPDRQTPGRQPPRPRPAQATEVYRSATTRGRWAQGLIVLVALAAVYRIWATWGEIGLLARLRDGLFVTFDEATTSDAHVSTAGLLYLAGLVPAVVVYLMWIHRAVANLALVRSGNLAQPLRFSPGWAVGWYFVPIMNLFRPIQVMGELYRESDPGHRSTALIVWWWLLWVLAAVLGAGLTGLVVDSGAGQAIISNWRLIASDVLVLVAAALIYLIIDRIDRWQDERARRFGLA